MGGIKSITLAPQASDDNFITTAETLAAARLTFLINGAGSTGYDRNGIATSQTPTSAAALTLDGALGIDFHSRKGVYVIIYAAADDSGRTFTVVGKGANDEILTEAITGPGLGLIVISTTRFLSITSVTPDAATAGAIEVGVNGYIDFAQAQHVTIVSAGDDSGDTFTVTGENRYEDALTESITGADSVAALGTKNFGRVDKVTSSGASTGDVEVGVNGLAESQWYVLNYRGPDFNIGLGVQLSTSASLTYTVQHTFHDVLADDFAEDDATTYNHESMVTKTAASDGNYINPPTATRLAITAHTSGSAVLKVVHAGRS